MPFCYDPAFYDPGFYDTCPSFTDTRTEFIGGQGLYEVLLSGTRRPFESLHIEQNTVMPDSYSVKVSQTGVEAFRTSVQVLRRGTPYFSGIIERRTPQLSERFTNEYGERDLSYKLMVRRLAKTTFSSRSISGVARTLASGTGVVYNVAANYSTFGGITQQKVWSGANWTSWTLSGLRISGIGDVRSLQILRDDLNGTAFDTFQNTLNARDNNGFCRRYGFTTPTNGNNSFRIQIDANRSSGVVTNAINIVSGSTIVATTGARALPISAPAQSTGFVTIFDRLTLTLNTAYYIVIAQTNASPQVVRWFGQGVTPSSALFFSSGAGCASNGGTWIDSNLNPGRNLHQYNTYRKSGIGTSELLKPSRPESWQRIVGSGNNFSSTVGSGILIVRNSGNNSNLAGRFYMSTTENSFVITGISVTANSGIRARVILTSITGNSSPKMNRVKITYNADAIDFTVDNEYAFDALKRLGTIVQGESWVSSGNNFYFVTQRGTDRRSGVIYRNNENCQIIEEPANIFKLANRIYVIGAGSGSNRILQVASDTTSINTYGLRDGIYVNKEIDTSGTADIAKRNLLTKYKNPIRSFRILNIQSRKDVMPGDQIRIVNTITNTNTGVRIKRKIVDYDGVSERVDLECGDRLIDFPDDFVAFNDFYRWFKLVS